jgi:dihydrofolate reductase
MRYQNRVFIQAGRNLTDQSDSSSTILVSLVVAMARNGVIGRDGGLPWRLSSDLRRFKANTIGRPVVMGRKTFQSIGKPLPGRDNIVVTRDMAFAPEGIYVCGSVDSALDLARRKAGEAEVGEICVIGGGELYRQTIGVADKLVVTFVEADIVGDTKFPVIDPAIWIETSSEDHPAGEKDSHSTRHVVYERRV